MKIQNLQTELYRCLKMLDIKKISEEDKKELLHFFSVTENILICNHIALIFSDIKFESSVKIIIKKILNSNVDNVGTLVYALDGLNCKKEFISIIKILCTKNYEARLHAFEIIQKYIDSVSTKTKNRALKILEEYRVKQEKKSSDKGEDSPLHFIEQSILLFK